MYIAHMALPLDIRFLTELAFKKDLTKIFIFGVRRLEIVEFVWPIVIAIVVVKGGVIFQHSGRFLAD